MATMLEMIQKSAVPANVMRTAARGALALSAPEMLEILVYLTTHGLFGEEARMTLAGWDEASAREVLSSPEAPPTVLAYFLNPANWRPKLIPVLLENPLVDEHALMDLAASVSREVAAMMLASPRILEHKWVLKQLFANPRIAGSAEYTKLMQLLAPPVPIPEVLPTLPAVPAPEGLVDEDHIIKEFHREHADEIAAEEGKAFELVKTEDPDEADELAELVKVAQAKAEADVVAATEAAKKKAEPERLSTIQKINRMSVGERVQLAVKGSKDDRSVLIRDGSKVVSLAVLESPKITDSEMATFAGMKNIQQTVLRAIAGKRKFLKQYSVQRALTANPRLPLECALKLLPNLLVSDLQQLSKNKNVSDTLRKLALKLYKDRSTARK